LFAGKELPPECRMHPRRTLLYVDCLPTDGGGCLLLNGDFGTSPFCWQL
jgi:hypothetical protein